MNSLDVLSGSSAHHLPSPDLVDDANKNILEILTFRLFISAIDCRDVESVRSLASLHICPLVSIIRYTLGFTDQQETIYNLLDYAQDRYVDMPLLEELNRQTSGYYDFYLRQKQGEDVIITDEGYLTEYAHVGQKQKWEELNNPSGFYQCYLQERKALFLNELGGLTDELDLIKTILFQFYKIHPVSATASEALIEASWSNENGYAPIKGSRYWVLKWLSSPYVDVNYIRTYTYFFLDVLCTDTALGMALSSFKSSALKIAHILVKHGATKALKIQEQCSSIETSMLIGKNRGIYKLVFLLQHPDLFIEENRTVRQKQSEWLEQIWLSVMTGSEYHRKVATLLLQYGTEVPLRFANDSEFQEFQRDCLLNRIEVKIPSEADAEVPLDGSEVSPEYSESECSEVIIEELD